MNVLRDVSVGIWVENAKIAKLEVAVNVSSVKFPTNVPVVAIVVAVSESF